MYDMLTTQGRDVTGIFLAPASLNIIITFLLMIIPGATAQSLTTVCWPQVHFSLHKGERSFSQFMGNVHSTGRIS